MEPSARPTDMTSRTDTQEPTMTRTEMLANLETARAQYAATGSAGWAARIRTLEIALDETPGARTAADKASGAIMVEGGIVLFS